MENSKIEWTDHTFNPWIGCTNVSEGCDKCYAELMSQRYGWAKWGKGQKRRLTSESNWKKPVSWNAEAARKGTRYRVFCASLADVMDLEVPNEWREKLWDLISRTPNLDWLLLTKRPQHFKRFLPWMKTKSAPWPNVWLGTTTESQRRFDERVPILTATPAALRFLSMEPLIGPIEVKALINPATTKSAHQIDWAIVGGESGPGSRQLKIDWVKDIVKKCKASGVDVFVKQMGTNNDLGKRLTDRKGTVPTDWPTQVRIRQVPDSQLGPATSAEA